MRVSRCMGDTFLLPPGSRSSVRKQTCPSRSKAAANYCDCERVDGFTRRGSVRFGWLSASRFSSSASGFLKYGLTPGCASK